MMQQLSLLPQRTAGLLRAVFYSVLCAQLALTAGVSQAQTESDGEDQAWYRTEILIFVRSDEEALSAENWEPLPTLSYPNNYRFLVTPSINDQRLAESAARESQIDDIGVQHLTVAAPQTLLELVDRPDLIFSARPSDEEASSAPSPEDPNDTVDLIRTAESRSAERSPPESATDLDENAETTAHEIGNTLDPIPFLELSADSLGFKRQAIQLRRRGYEVLFHKAWWAPLQDQKNTLPIIIERSGDPDVSNWPRLQGSVSVYLSRYLHAVIDLWTNTDAAYLPAGWQIETPPLAPPSVVSATLAGADVNPWAPADTELAETVANNLPSIITEPPQAIEETNDPMRKLGEEPAVRYPWRHAIRHQQSRRMRGGEIHYLDHPVIGVLVRVDAQEESLAPPSAEPGIEFRARHGLPLPISAEFQESLADETQPP